jgi:hypothetical protein
MKQAVHLEVPIDRRTIGRKILSLMAMEFAETAQLG